MKLLAGAFWVCLCSAIAGVLVAPGDWFGVALVLCLLPVGLVSLWYIMDDAAPSGYSTRLTLWVREKWWHAALFVVVVTAFMVHILTGWPSQGGQ